MLNDMKKRIDSVDMFRGIAVLQMIIWQIFDFFYVKNIYSDPPYLLKFFNMPVNGIGLGLFAFIAGTSIYLSFSKKKKISQTAIIKHFIKDMGIALKEAKRMKLSLPGLSLAYRFYDSAMKLGFENLGTQGLYKVFEKMNNL